MTSLPLYYGVTNPSTMTSLTLYYVVTNPYYDVTNPSTMTSLTLYYVVTNPYYYVTNPSLMTSLTLYSIVTGSSSSCYGPLCRGEERHGGWAGGCYAMTSLTSLLTSLLCRHLLRY